MWRKLLRDEEPRPSIDARPIEDDDPQLVAWNDYLAQVHRDDQSDQKPSS
jgi:hypothetical protein